jgi:hypothetical protein
VSLDDLSSAHQLLFFADLDFPSSELTHFSDLNTTKKIWLDITYPTPPPKNGAGKSSDPKKKVTPRKNRGNPGKTWKTPIFAVFKGKSSVFKSE